MVEDMMSEVRDLDERIGRLDREILEIATPTRTHSA
jgi:hypothetical protein